ncbi:hypothetical protein SASPL_119828 [Salvia splendens]|uniref:dolichol kinase n=1 Tax=Salvia splendens TaxID=180675 RepID=A0A8X8ZVL9_SALSN|nr:hypothetical protein SASPL_119828 [Salvia splendens]
MAPQLLRQLNGERAVVLLYVVRIIFSIPFSLLPEAFSLSLLFLLALCVEISVDDASNPLSLFFRTRPGASSGVLLGAVTLPGLLVSKLVQTSRAITLEEVGIEEFEYLKSQYWAASSSCVAVLIFLSLVCQHQGKSKSKTSISSLSSRNQIYSSICVIFFVGSGLVSLSGKLYGGWAPVLVSLWVLGHGWAAVTLIQKILETFPACASIGESLLVTTGLVLYFGDMMAYTTSKISYLASSDALFIQNGINRSEISTIIQPKFLDLSFGAALAVFLLLETIRIWKIWPLGHLVHQFMNAFTDHRDSDLLVVSHFSLLLGCAIPIWLASGFTDRPLAPFAGILSLGIGDTMASMVGHKYGVLRWSKTGKKTIEGTAAGITSVLAACFVLLPLLAATGYIFTMHWFSLIVAVTTSGLLEAYTAQLDNAFIPLVFYSMLCL